MLCPCLTNLTSAQPVGCVSSRLFLHDYRAGGLLRARLDRRLDSKTSKGQDYFVLSSCVPWNLIGEAVRRLQREEDSARDAAASARQAGDEARARSADEAQARWAHLKGELTREVRFCYSASLWSC